MRKPNIPFALCLFLPCLLLSQVGINNTDPRASLDITATNTATPDITDGILIPRIDDFPVTAPAAAQDGMMVFATGYGTPAKGFYYWDNTLTSWIAIEGLRNTLDAAYDQGGPGAGNTIEAVDGAVTISGEDGLLITGTIGSGDPVVPDLTYDSQFYFNPNKGAIRAGNIYNTNWDDINVGTGSAAFGYSNLASASGTFAAGLNNSVSGLYSAVFGTDNIVTSATSFATGSSVTASGSSSTAMGFNTTASGGNSFAANASTTASASNSFAINQGTIASGSYSFSQGLATTASAAASSSFGVETNAYSFAETAVGTYNTTYAPASTSAFNANDRVFVVGNGPNSSNRSDAFSVWKDGRVIINEAYSLPLSDGGIDQAIVTNGSGTLTWGSVARRINQLSDGKSDDDGTDNGSSIFLGLNAGDNDDSSDNQNIGIGRFALTSNTTGFGNVSVGYAALSSNMTASSNTAIGHRSMNSNTTGTNNTGVGTASLLNNTTGYSNVAIGRDALLNNNTGNLNTALGVSSLRLNAQGNSNIAIGNSALYSNTTASSNIAIGNTSMYNNTSGTENIALGTSALNANTAGNRNVAIGPASTASNTSGNSNVAVGFYSLLNNTTGSNNVALGTQALYSNTTGINNIALGFDALRLSGTANSNIAIGYYAMRTAGNGSNNIALGNNTLENNVNGTENIAIGHNALNSNSSGFTNVAIGYNVLAANTTGASNYSLGYTALQNNTIGNANVAIGLEVLQSNSSGSLNTGIGNGALQFNTIGDHNVGVGGGALQGVGSGSRNTAVGLNAGMNASGSDNVFLGYNAGMDEAGGSKLYIENTNANANSALIYGEFDTNLLRFNADVEIDNGNLDVDSNSLFVDAAANRVGVRTNSPDYPFSVTGSANLNEGIATGVALRVNGSEAIWFDGSYFSWGFGGTANYFADYVGIGTTTPNTRLDIEGGSDATLGGGGYITLGAITTTNLVFDDNEIMARNNGSTSNLHLQLDGGNVLVGGAVVHTSDKRLKRDIEPIGYGLAEILQLEPKKYYWKNRADTEKKSLGLLAQDVQKIIENVVYEREDVDKTLSVNYTELIPVLIKAIQEQQQQIDTLKELLKNSQIQESRLKKLEALLLPE